ncbi:MAG: IS200/IS605 family transposase [Candidatus Cloacimonetes bacterium]|nr:IS200/IS605 family transposase [Candidatus Cloacimonadota bacterium]MCF7814104.1 IS200/IS605 family transposase [Candidatus Cloacimonadota bacterium]MCF7867967.1 IS200/IS605 family transposase [Candidatus Cloacimonadota bacterium]MCF7883425.1 IS200/IS605 family transposase [Candidatus Cloacimonadota bacterium]
MSHSLNRIWIHAVWSTKNRFPFLTNQKQTIFSKLDELLKEQQCENIVINGFEEHVHSLFLLNPNKNISEIIKNIKGSSSHWINQKELFKVKFAWQVGFASFSVSESLVEKVSQYIKNQELHHKKMSFSEEWNLLLKKHNLVIEENH